MAEYGSLIFEECTDSFRRLKYWKDPLWDHVAQELKNENQLSDPNQNVVPEEPKAEKISSIVLSFHAFSCTASRIHIQPNQ